MIVAQPPEPTLLKAKYERRPWTRNKDQVVKPTWSIEKSIFRRRKGEADAKDYYDTDKLLGAQVRFRVIVFYPVSAGQSTVLDEEVRAESG